jgi:hypothetical protein
MSDTPSKWVRMHRLVWASLIMFGVMLLLLTSTGEPLRSQAEVVQEIGVGQPGLGAYQFVGRIDQDGFEFTGYGYLYDIQGLTPTELFSNPANASETTARFTYYATATLTSRAIVTDTVRGIFALDSVGTITYYHQATPSASFADPESFANGIPIATASIRFQDILSVQSPNRGIAVGKGEFSVSTTTPFTFGGESVRFGREGLTYQIATFGDGLRTNAQIPQSSVLLAGSAVNSGFRQTFLPLVSNRPQE